MQPDLVATADEPRSSRVEPSGCFAAKVRWGVEIPLRDGTLLNGNLYLPAGSSPAPCILMLTPYVAQTYHERGLFFARNGYPFLIVDVRGRGNSEGSFWPFRHEGDDGYEVVQWLATQPFCDGKVSMWGGSYSGFAQWATACKRPPNLAAIAPVASPCLGVDLPGRSNIPIPYLMQWLTLVWGRASQDSVFASKMSYWARCFRDFHRSGQAFTSLDRWLGLPSEIFREWTAHPHQGGYWDGYNPTAECYSQVDIPVLTITGMYDADQLGALHHYRDHLRNAGPAARHFLVIGPWDHAGTRTPAARFCGIEVGPASLVDLPNLHLEWYAWTMRGGPRPSFLENNVAYYVAGADKWRYADMLDTITAGHIPYALASSLNPTDIYRAGLLSPEQPASGEPDKYVYDPSDVSLSDLEASVDPDDKRDHRLAYAATGKRLFYQSEPFTQSIEISGFFRLTIWLAIDQPDTDIQVSIYEVAADGSALELSGDFCRARYRRSLRHPELLDTSEPLKYEFANFMFVSREIKAGHRLRLVIGPLNSINFQKNYNSGKAVAEETVADARIVTVQLFHDDRYPSALHVPFAQGATSVEKSSL